MTASSERPASRVGAAASVLAALVLVIGVPVALVLAVGWPLPHDVPTLDEARAAFDHRGVPTRVVIDVLAVIVWLAWVQLAWAIAAETIALARGRAAGRAAFLPGVQHLAGHLVASAALIATTLTPARAATPASHQPLAALETPTAHAGPTGAHPSAPAEAARRPEVVERVHDIVHGDTFWGLAERYLGDGARWREIRDHNIGRAVAPGRTLAATEDALDVGWRLLIPTTPQPPAPAGTTGPGPVPTPIPAPGGRPAPAGATTNGDGHQVTAQPGDSMWRLAEHTLFTRLGRPATDDEIRGYWIEFVEANRDRLIHPHSPDLIHTGQTFELPPVEAPPGDSGSDDTAAPTPPADQPAPGPPPENGSDTPVDADHDPTTSTRRPPGPPDQAGPTTTNTPTTSHPPSSAEAAPAPTSAPATTAPTGREPAPALPDQTDADDSSDTGIADVLIPAGVSAALAALTLRALARRRRARRRSARPGATTPARPARDIETERALATASGDALDRVWHTVRALNDPLRTLPDPPTVTGIVVHPTGDVTIHLDAPTAPVEPFIPSPATPSAWHLPADQAEPLPDDEVEPVPVLETVVALGTTDEGDWVFLDLESVGAISIDGDRHHATRLLRSITAELALQPTNHYVDLTVVGSIGTPTITEQGIVTVDRLDETLVRRLQRTATDTDTYLAAEHTASTHTGRARGLPRDGLVVTVVAAGRSADPVLLHRLSEASMPGGRGLALVALDPLLDPAIQLVAHDDGEIRIPHLGLTATAAGLDADELRRVDGLLASEPDSVTAGPDTSDIATTPADAAATPDNPAWDYQVRLFADHRVETRDGDTISFRYGGDNPAVPNKNTNRGPELLAYLTLRPDRAATTDEIRDHLWWGKSISERTVTTLIYGTRKVLGGTTYLSYAEGDPHRSKYLLAPTVVTDVELVGRALAYARATGDGHPDSALAALRTALVGVEAPAFRGRRLGSGLADWAAANRITDKIEQPLIESALLAADLWKRQGPDGLTQALWAIDQALNACPTNEALIRAAMQLDAHRGHSEAVNSRFTALAAQLARDDLEPEPETTELRNDLLGIGHRIG